MPSPRMSRAKSFPGLPDPLKPAMDRSGRVVHTLPALPYKHFVLEPCIDTGTMHLHHDIYHATSVKRLNDALAEYPELQTLSVEELLLDVNRIPEGTRVAVRSHAGAHLNHSLFWRTMGPANGATGCGTLLAAIDHSFGSFNGFRSQFVEAGVNHVGSGWVWLALSAQRNLQIITTTNHENPIQVGLYPIMGNDLWEHAYFLRYQNRRAEYLERWWKVVNWPEVSRRFIHFLDRLQTPAA